jgi:serpin B
MWVAVALMMATVLTGCSKDNSETEPVPITEPMETTDPTEPDDDEPLVPPENNEPKPIQLTRSELELVSGNNDFAFNFFRLLCTNADVYTNTGGPYTCIDPEESKFVSPISITYALGLLNNGAAGKTQAQINKVLGFKEAGADGINEFCHKMLTEAPNLDQLTKVLIANNIYMNKGYELLPDFVSKARLFYEADVETRDFHDGLTRDVINKWGSDHTMGMIPEVLKEDDFNPNGVSYLLNAIYFKGAWIEKFDKDKTKDEEFATGYGSEKKLLPMMHQERKFNYMENDLCQALRLPYGNGTYAMTILLPKEGKNTHDVLKTLTAETWQEYQWISDRAIVDVKLPRFETDYAVNLIPIMTALGMPNAFDFNLAEFPNFCNVPTYIRLMKQVAKIKLNEEGTEAAAVTIEAGGAAGSGRPLYVNFHANHPFIYVISERFTGAIFFIGKYVGD